MAEHINIEAAQIAKMELDEDCIVERSMVVSRAPESMPFVGLKGRYNKRWYVDIITFPHNAARRQMSDLFTTITAMYKMSLDLTESDLQTFYRYLTVQCDFYKALLEGEEVALFSHMHREISVKRLVRESKVQVLSAEYRLNIKKELFEHLNSALQHRYTMVPAMQALEQIRRSFDLFARKVLDYFSEKEKALPKLLLRSIRGSREKTRYESRLISYLLSKPSGYQLVVLLLRALMNDDVRAEFVARHFPKPEQKDSFASAVNAVNDEVFQIVSSIQNAAHMYEKRFSMKTFIKHYGHDNDMENAVKVIA